MKKFLSLSTLVLAGLLAILLFCRVDCSDTANVNQEPELCGKEICNFKIFGTNEMDVKDFFLRVEDDWAIYEFSVPSFDSVCAHKHISGSFSVECDRMFYYEVNMMVKAEVVYGILYTYPISDWSIDDGYYVFIKSYYEFGMKNVYGDEPGWFLPILTLSLPVQQNIGHTHEVLQEYLKAVYISWKYNQWKLNS